MDLLQATVGELADLEKRAQTSSCRCDMFFLRFLSFFSVLFLFYLFHKKRLTSGGVQQKDVATFRFFESESGI